MAQAIDEVEIPTDGAALTRACALLDRLNAKVSAAVAEFDEAELWEPDAATSMIAWLRTQTGRSNRDAARATKTARRLRALPCLAAGWQDGSLTGGQIDAVLANLPARQVPRFAEVEDLVAHGLEGLPIAQTVEYIQRWVRKADAVDPKPIPDEPEQSLHHSRTLGDRYETTGSFDPEGGALIATALRVATTKDLDGERRRTPSERNADALLDIMQFFLDHQQTQLGGRHRPHANVLVDLHDVDGGGDLVAGPHLDADSIKRLLCDAGIHRLVTDGASTVLDYGRTTRTVSAAQFAALVAIHGVCGFGECDRGPEWVDAHHIIHWTDGGPTDLDNLAPGCRRHHRYWHRHSCEVKKLPNGEIHTTTPDGRVFIHRPRPRGPSDPTLSLDP